MTKLCVSLSAICLLLGSCRGAEPADPAPADASPAEEAPASEADDDPVLVVFLGDSLTAGYGLEAEQAHPARIEERLLAEGRPVRVVNAGVSGDTTAGGLSRLDWLLRQRPDVLVVSLGGNDGLRGLQLSSSEDNLRRIVERARAAGARVLLTGMKMPPNYGDYADDFAAMYPRLAGELGVPLVPFLLDGIADRPDLFLADGIHPTAEGQAVLAETVLPYLLPLVEAAAAAPETDLPED